jgi:receptor-type tyrosine-protein phosphatase R
MGCAASGSSPSDVEKYPPKVEAPPAAANGAQATASIAVKGVVAPPKGAFAKLPTNLVGPDTLPQPWKLLSSRNRYIDILPNPESRVRLQMANGDPLTEYINANFIRGIDGSPAAYIATQGPKPETVGDFWRMVWEQIVVVIVMLTGFVEQGKTKCERYWSINDKLGSTQVYGDFHVTTVSVSSRGAYQRSELELRRGKDFDGEARIIHHFWYNTWPDHGVPADVTGVLRMHEEVRQHDAPWLLHCSAGIGRTGTFIGIDMGSRLLANGDVADVIALIQRMRQDRGGMVQTDAQADFMYRVLECLPR